MATACRLKYSLRWRGLRAVSKAVGKTGNGGSEQVSPPTLPTFQCHPGNFDDTIERRRSHRRAPRQS